MNDQVIIAVANAITAQAETLKALIDALPKETKAAVEKKVAQNTLAPAPVATPAPVVTAPVVQVVPASVAPTPAPVPVVAAAPASVMPAAPFPVATPVAVAPAPVVAAAPAPATVSPSNLPFSDKQGMINWVMAEYRNLGSRGAEIQGVLTNLGAPNINDVTPDKYDALVAGVMALRG